MKTIYFFAGGAVACMAVALIALASGRPDTATLPGAAALAFLVTSWFAVYWAVRDGEFVAGSFSKGGLVSRDAMQEPFGDVVFEDRPPSMKVLMKEAELTRRPEALVKERFTGQQPAPLFVNIDVHGVTSQELARRTSDRQARALSKNYGAASHARLTGI